MKRNLLKIVQGMLSLSLIGVAFTINPVTVKTDSNLKTSKESKPLISLKAPTQFTANTVSFLANEIMLLTAPKANNTQLVAQTAATIPINNTTVVQQYQTAPVAQATPVNYVSHTALTSGASGIVLTNGNTAGEIGSAAAARMAAATGVPQSTWEYIIARESNGNPSAANPSGASGLFQTMPGWGSTATVDDQINSALNAYNNQGLAAWGY